MGETRFPFPAYPNGWFCVGYADELPSGGVAALRYFGRDLVLFREDGGDVRVLDAYCPHLGAHLGHGGQVEGDSIRCPFHGWLWAGDGTCREVPYAKRIPPAARMRAWPSCQRNGFLYLWHHADGMAPDFEIPELPEHGSSDWGDYSHLRWTVASRMYDMGENAVDHVHFKYLHGASGSPTQEQKVGSEGVRNFSRMKMTTPRGPVEGSIESQATGPGIGVVRVKGVVDTIILTQSTPIDEEHVDVRFSYLQRATDDPREQRVGAAMLRDLKRQMEQDIVVFEHKTYWKTPLLVPEDGPIADYRRRARKWYSGRFWDEGPASG
jgi:3-ketosteroid 9alpha-monooxygenase subunit A